MLKDEYMNLSLNISALAKSRLDWLSVHEVLVHMKVKSHMLPENKSVVDPVHGMPRK